MTRIKALLVGLGRSVVATTPSSRFGRIALLGARHLDPCAGLAHPPGGAAGGRWDPSLRRGSVRAVWMLRIC